MVAQEIGVFEKYKHQQLRKTQIQKSWTINVQKF